MAAPNYGDPHIIKTENTAAPNVNITVPVPSVNVTATAPPATINVSAPPATVNVSAPPAAVNVTAPPATVNVSAPAVNVYPHVQLGESQIAIEPPKVTVIFLGSTQLPAPSSDSFVMVTSSNEVTLVPGRALMAHIVPKSTLAQAGKDDVLSRAQVEQLIDTKIAETERTRVRRETSQPPPDASTTDAIFKACVQMVDDNNRTWSAWVQQQVQSLESAVLGLQQVLQQVQTQQGQQAQQLASLSQQIVQLARGKRP
uniref:LO4 n=1 Tax=Carp adomavirus TaxID=2609874 RepID=A0A6F9F3M0_9VIRU|nr:TPA_asm: LO4 [Carp adomavirus]